MARFPPAGKQSLARLAASICGYEVFQIAVSSTYGVNEFKAVRLSCFCVLQLGRAWSGTCILVRRSCCTPACASQHACTPLGEGGRGRAGHGTQCPSPPTHTHAHLPYRACVCLQDLLSLYQKAGAKGTPVVLLMTDNQIVKESFLVYINDLLANGDIPDLCTQEDKDNFCNAVRRTMPPAHVQQRAAALCLVCSLTCASAAAALTLCCGRCGTRSRQRAWSTHLTTAGSSSLNG